MASFQFIFESTAKILEATPEIIAETATEIALEITAVEDAMLANENQANAADQANERKGRLALGSLEPMEAESTD
ncbi:MAG: hypothetical protein SNJ60_00665 [Pseudanabaenaceae cyanobacterium]